MSSNENLPTIVEKKLECRLKHDDINIWILNKIKDVMRDQSDGNDHR